MKRTGGRVPARARAAGAVVEERVAVVHRRRRACRRRRRGRVACTRRSPPSSRRGRRATARRAGRRERSRAGARDEVELRDHELRRAGVAVAVRARRAASAPARPPRGGLVVGRRVARADHRVDVGGDGDAGGVEARAVRSRSAPCGRGGRRTAGSACRSAGATAGASAACAAAQRGRLVARRPAPGAEEARRGRRRLAADERGEARAARRPGRGPANTRRSSRGAVGLDAPARRVARGGSRCVSSPSTSTPSPRVDSSHGIGK